MEDTARPWEAEDMTAPGTWRTESDSGTWRTRPAPGTKLEESKESSPEPFRPAGQADRPTKPTEG